MWRKSLGALYLFHHRFIGARSLVPQCALHSSFKPGLLGVSYTCANDQIGFSPGGHPSPIYLPVQLDECNGRLPRGTFFLASWNSWFVIFSHNRNIRHNLSPESLQRMDCLNETAAAIQTDMQRNFSSRCCYQSQHLSKYFSPLQVVFNYASSSRYSCLCLVFKPQVRRQGLNFVMCF